MEKKQQPFSLLAVKRERGGGEVISEYKRGGGENEGEPLECKVS